MRLVAVFGTMIEGLALRVGLGRGARGSRQRQLVCFIVTCRYRCCRDGHGCMKVDGHGHHGRSRTRCGNKTWERCLVSSPRHEIIAGIVYAPYGMKWGLPGLDESLALATWWID